MHSKKLLKVFKLLGSKRGSNQMMIRNQSGGPRILTEPFQVYKAFGWNEGGARILFPRLLVLQGSRYTKQCCFNNYSMCPN